MKRTLVAVVIVAGCSSSSAPGDVEAASGEAAGEETTLVGADAAESTVDAGLTLDARDAADDADTAAPALQFIGRFDGRDPNAVTCGWSGCRVVARFVGVSASVELNELAHPWMAGGPSEWDVAIDGVWQQKIVTVPGLQTISLATGLSPGPHRLDLLKRNEAESGVTQLRHFDFGGGALLPPPPRRARRIEVIGDSNTAAYGVEATMPPDGVCPGGGGAARWQSFRRSWGARLGELLDAEVHSIAYSGKGIVKNLWRPDTVTMPALFLRANPADETSAWDFTSWAPHVVIVMMGGNDFAVGQPDESDANAPPTLLEFENGYRAFVATIRSKYPAAHLLLAVSAANNDVEPAGRNVRTTIMNVTTTIAAERVAAGDANVHAFSPAPSPASELTACDGHGNDTFHGRVAAEFASQLKTVLGW